MGNNKYFDMKHLADETFLKVTKDPIEWKKFLLTASRISRYTFEDQLLIYAQRPDATGCASFQLWNDKMHCYVNKGAKGIALIDRDSEQSQKLRYVFDISDVHEAKNIGHKPKMWAVSERHKDSILDRLEFIYGENTPKDESFENRIRSLCYMLAMDVSKDIIESGVLSSDKDYGVFESLHGNDRMELELVEMISSSLAYTVLTRCGIETSAVDQILDFSRFKSINNLEELFLIGTSVSNLAAPMLKEIGNAVRIYDRKHNRENILENVEKSINVRYNTLKRESESANDAITERSGEYGTSIYSERGLSDTEYSSEQGTGRNADEVGTDASELSERERELAVSSLGDSGQVEESLLF